MNWPQKLLGRTPAQPAAMAAFRKKPNGIHALRVGGTARRHGEVRFFPPHFEGRARAWLAE